MKHYVYKYCTEVYSLNERNLFAQQWISVDDELPEIDKEDCWNSTHKWSKMVITKNDELNFPNYEIKAYNPELHEWQTSNKVTHWRPIESS